MAVIKSGASSDQLTVDAVSKAARTTIYDPAGAAASVFDYANSNPVAVRLTDTNGDYVGAGTQYTEDEAAAANPIGSAQILVRSDAPGAVTDANGDNVARRGTNYGAAYTQIITSAGAFVDSFGGGVQYTEGDTDATITGTAFLWEDAADTLRTVSSTKPLPVDVKNTSLAVTGTFWQATQPVSAASLPLPTGAATEATLSTLNGKVTACNTGAVAGTVTANAGTNLNTSLLALEAGGNLASINTKLVSGTDIGDVTINNGAGAGAVNIQDGGNSITVDGTVTADTELTTGDLDTGVGTDTRAVVGLVGTADGGGQLIPGSSTDGLLVNLGANNDVTVTGTITANAGANLNTSALALEAGNLATIAGDTTSIDGKITACNTGAVVVSSGNITVSATDLDVRNLAPATDTVAIGDGVATATIRNLAANDALNVAIVDAGGDQITTFGGGTEYTTDAAAPANPVGGSVLAERDDQLAALTEVEGDWTNVRANAKGALWVTIPDANGDPITSFGGGVQYTEGDTDATITGTAMLMEGAANTLVPAQGTAADGLLVNLGANNDVAVTGTVTANVSAPTAFSVDQSGALEASSVTKASAGTLYKVSGRLDSTAPSGTYYVQFLNASSLPADGAVTHLLTPIKIQAVAGIDSLFSVDAVGDDKYGGVSAGTGIVWCLSSTEFTKTISNAYISATVLYV